MAYSKVSNNFSRHALFSTPYDNSTTFKKLSFVKGLPPLTAFSKASYNLHRRIVMLFFQPHMTIQLRLVTVLPNPQFAESIPHLKN